jgi:hypothetical protein
MTSRDDGREEGDGPGTAADTDADGSGAPPPPAPSPRPPAALVVAGAVAVLAVPLVVALAAQWAPRWFPLTDMAEYELNVRDVASAHPPLLGLPGRIYGYGVHGSHPGPLGFYLLWPVYQLMGGDGWGLQASTAVLALAAAGLAVWVGHRRGGWPFALAVTATLALLMRGYGATILLETWNPHLPLLWWVAFLLAVWAVLCHDLRALPVAVVAGSVCMQTHISYIPLVGGLGLLVAVVLGARLVRAHRARRDRGGDPDEAGDPTSWRRSVAWIGGSLGLGVLLWLPPLAEQLTHSPGNVSVIRQNFSQPGDTRLPFGDAVTLWLEHFDVTAITGAELKPLYPFVDIGTDTLGLMGLAVWAAAAVLAWRYRDPVLLRLHLVAGCAAALGLAGMSRILGPPWPYLTYWAWGTTAVALLATVWTFVSTAPAGQAAPARAAPSGVPAVPAVPAARWPRPAAVALAALTALVVAVFAVEAADVEMDDEERSWTLAQVAGPTVERLQRLQERPRSGDDRAGCGGDCRVLITWTDESPAAGTQVLGLLVALEREGIDARVPPGLEDHARSHRVSHPADADVELHLAVDSPAIAQWRSRDDAELVASARPRDPETAEPVAVFLVTPDGAGPDAPSPDGIRRGL